MKSFAIAAFAGAASAAWAPPAYGGQSSPVASSSAPPAEGYSQPPAGYSQPPAGYQSSEVESSSTPSAPAYTAPTAPAYSAPSGYAPSSASSSMATYACNPAHSYPNGAQCVSTYGTLSLVTPSPSAPAYGTGAPPAYSPKPTGGWGGSYGNGTQGGYGGDMTVTQIVSSYVTTCPYATTFSTNGATYTATESEVITITDCPCEAPTPVASIPISYTTDVVTSFTTTCPEAGVITAGPSTYTVTKSQVLTVTDCGSQGCSVSKPVPATVVVPSYTTVCPSPSAPTVYTIESSTYSVTDETTITVQAPTSYATVTSVYASPATPTSVVVESSTIQITSATSVVMTVPTQGGYTITTPVQSIPGYSATPAASTPVAPVAPASSGYPAPSQNGSSPVSPAIPEQTGNGAVKAMAGGAAFFVAVGAFFL